jgi:hypothetical protein
MSKVEVVVQQPPQGDATASRHIFTLTEAALLLLAAAVP